MIKKSALTAIITSGVCTDVWDVVYPVDKTPVLVVHVPDVGAWWSKAKPVMDRVFECSEHGVTGIPGFVKFRPGVVESDFCARFLALEPPVSFGFGVVWCGLSSEGQKKLADLLKEKTSGLVRVAVGGGLYRVVGKRAIPQEFQTPWAAWEVLRKWCGADTFSAGLPGLLRSFQPWEMGGDSWKPWCSL